MRHVHALKHVIDILLVSTCESLYGVTAKTRVTWWNRYESFAQVPYGLIEVVIVRNLFIIY